MGATARNLSQQAEVFWYLAKGESLRGPYSKSEIQQLLKDGNSGWYEFCWRPGFQEWRPLFCVEEFSEIKNQGPVILAQTSFPTVALPNQNRSKDQNKDVVRPKRVTVTLNRTHKKVLSIYEWLLAFSVTLVFGFMCAKVAIDEMTHGLVQRLESKHAGELLELGPKQSKTISIQQLQPMLSAPGVEAVLSNSQIESSHAVSWLGFPVKDQVEGWALSQNLKQMLWRPEPADLDSIYVRQHHLKAQIVFDGSHYKLDVPNRGEPTLLNQ